MKKPSENAGKRISALQQCAALPEHGTSQQPDSAAESSVPADEESPLPSALLWKRLALVVLAGIPFFLTLPYTFHSWRVSPMDRPNWILHLGFLLLAACVAPIVKDSARALNVEQEYILLKLMLMTVVAVSGTIEKRLSCANEANPAHNATSVAANVGIQFHFLMRASS